MSLARARGWVAALPSQRHLVLVAATGAGLACAEHLVAAAA
ncbi:MAG: hypothetical protein QOJ07_2592, partial [Thermoleophilaceae bacterium]|nr:hypothetical protein [Thermoleophilaceae bacterium]